MIRILIAEDHPLMRDAILGVVEDEEDIEVVGLAGNGQEAVEAAVKTRPDIILMDLYMPVKDGLTAIEEIMSSAPQTHILVFSSSQEEEKISAAVEAGVLGFVNKDIQRTELLHAIREVSQGRAYLPPAVVTRLLSAVRKNKGIPSSSVLVEPLTPREQDIVNWIKKGHTNRQIAAELTLSEGTVRTHVHNILQKLGLQNRNQIILYK
jgi:DNA-binding NarL/FixJ family response regulator